ncbi:MAG: hypothetical protein CBB97_14980 [Candidatus Endolissoclinum sp. TMED37]|nr:MAG: hypothetical protein CBB97_14980 [Candidatus Endolissoclinum sp. TMED37]
MIQKLFYNEFWKKSKRLTHTQILENEKYLNPSNRSSTIFPIFLNNESETKIQFLSYWLKNNSEGVVLSFKIRELEGNILHHVYKKLTRYKANTINISDYLDNHHNGLCGSIEIEIFTKDKPIYTFPAISLSFINKVSSSVVHSCIRTYNKREQANNYILSLPQTGFDVDFSDKKRNYICFFGGESKFYELDIKLTEENNDRTFNIKLKNDSYGKAHIIYLEDLVDEEDKKLFNNPKCSIYHDIKDVFPRFYAGIIDSNFVPSLTHTFFDTSNLLVDNNNLEEHKLRAKNKNPDKFFDAVFNLPLYPSNEFVSSIKSYKQNLNFEGEAFLSIYSVKGEKLFNKSLSKIEMKNFCEMSEFNLNELITKSKLSNDCLYSVSFSFLNRKVPFPGRFKLGFNLKRKIESYGSNICFSPIIMTENIINKPSCRRWFPLGGLQKYIGSVHNSSFSMKNIREESFFNLEFINQKGEIFLRKEKILENASIFINPYYDRELNQFLGDEGGWCMVTANTYCINAYYFSMSNRLIGGDHAF